MLPVTSKIAARAAALSLSSAEASRFSRHLLLPEVGVEGQRRLKAARVLIIGTGGLGSPASLYLAAAGIGTLGLVEFDTVDQSNLQRQILFRDADQNRPKIEAAIAQLKSLRPDLHIEPHPQRLSVENAEQIISTYDVILDGTDNFPTRYLANDACVLLKKPYVYGSIFRFEGQASVFYPPHGPCYRCLFAAPPPAEQAPSCAEAGVLGVLPGLIGTTQATEAIKLILGIGEPLMGRLLTFDALAMHFDEFRLRRDPGCPVCGEAPTITSLQSITENCSRALSPGGDGAGSTPAVPQLKTQDYYRLRQSGAAHVLLDVRSAQEAAICRIEGSELVPLHLLPSSLTRWPKDTQLVVYCKSGARSERAVRILVAAGFTKATNLTGGIIAWIDDCAPDLPRY